MSASADAAMSIEEKENFDEFDEDDHDSWWKETNKRRIFVGGK